MSYDIKLFYIHDPMCSWCWGYKPVFDQLVEQLPANITLQYIVGGLAPDSDEPMSQELRTAISGYWRKIQKRLGTEFNFDFWSECKPRRSTYPACRAVLAAKQQGYEVQMIHAIQRAYYLRALNPSNDDTHYQLAAELDLDVELFKQDYKSNKIELLLQEQIAQVRDLPVKSFPSLALQLGDYSYAIPVDYENVQATLEAIKTHV